MSAPFMVVGLGASAGGLQALKRFFEGTPAESGMAFVVVMHLSPEHESHAAGILQTVTRMPVTQVTESVKVEPNRVYVIPPTKHLAMADGMIVLSDPERPAGRHVAVDLFFRTLADTHEERAICVVLSGTGADGSVGIKRVKEAGGVALVQDPRDAEYDGMPRNAIATGVADFVLPVAEMPEKLLEIGRNAARIKLPAGIQTPLVDESQAAEEALRDVLGLVRSRTGHDFTHYKRATVLRRIERRMQVTTTADLPEYRDHLRDNPKEAGQLLKDLLIGVTNFFRDRQSFDAFEREAVPRLFADKSVGDVVRVWCVGCATGEEAYSVTMLLLEYAESLPHAPAVQVFATDIDDDAIAAARDGGYPDAIEADVPPSRLRRFFTKEPGGYRIGKEVRERVLFAAHNLIKDPPFSQLDAVTCRNLLIYLDRGVQAQVFRLFHFALRRGGCLFLGSSESIDGASDLFETLDKRHRLFRSQPPTRAARGPAVLPLSVPAYHRPAARPDGAGEHRRIALGELHRELLEQYAPPSVVVDAEYEIVHLSERAGRFLRMTGGEPSLNLLKAVLPELRMPLQAAFFQAMQSEKSTEAPRVRLRREGIDSYVNMVVRPSRDPESGGRFALVLFDEVEEALGPEGKEGADDAGNGATAVVRGLENEAQRLKEQLHATVEQYETTVEEFKASNEELQAINEELRSTTEELETSKEELQSVNEELRTVNQELKEKVDEVSAANDDLKNLMAATGIATVFLDRALNIKRYTPGALEVFRLLPADAGRPLTDITHTLDYPGLTGDAESVMASLHAIEREVSGRDGRTYLAHLLPYRTADDRIDGVVLTFVDVSEMKRVEERWRLSEERLRLLIESATDYAIFTIGVDRRVESWSAGAAALLGYSGEETLGRSGDVIFTPEDRAAGVPEREARIAGDEGRAVNERVHLRKDGSRFYGSGTVRPLRGDAGRLLGFVKIMRDLTESKRAQDLVRESEILHRAIAANLPGAAVFIVDRDFRYRLAEGTALREAGFEPAELEGRTVREAFPDLADRYESRYGTALAGESSRWEHESHGRHFVSHIAPLRNAAGDVYAALAVSYDISDRKLAEQAQRRSEERLRLALSAARMGVWSWDIAADRHRRDGDLNRLLGLEPVETDLPIDEFFGHVHPDDRAAVKAAFEASVRQGRHLNVEFRVVWPDGTMRWLRDQGEVFTSEVGGYMAGACMDVTERREAEEAVRASEERLRMVVESATDYAIVTLDEGRRVTGWSSGAAAVFGYAAEEMLGRSADLLFTPEDRTAGVPEAEAETARRDGRASNERWHLRKDGVRFYASGVLTRLTAGNFRGYVKIARDLTDRKQMEDELREARDRLEARVAERTAELIAANEARVELLRRLASAQEEERLRLSRELHDRVGQSVTGLILTLGAFEGRLPAASPDRGIVKLLRSAADEVAREMHDIALRLRPTALDDVGLPAALRNYVERWSARTGIAADFHVGFADRISAEAETALYRVVQEALNNALKHAEATRVSVLLERRDHTAVAIVEDNGAGFDVAAARRRGRLGLLGMEERMAAVGGDLEVESSPGDGTTVYARVPSPGEQEEEST